MRLILRLALRRRQWDVRRVVRDHSGVVPFVAQELCSCGAIGSVRLHVAQVDADAKWCGGVVLRKGGGR